MSASKPTLYLETHSTDPAYNLAFEETVLRNRQDRPYLLLWQNDNTIVVGQNQNTAAEIDPDFVEKHHIHVVRRTTGGGAVYHDMGNLNYSFITDVENAADMTSAVHPTGVGAGCGGVWPERHPGGRPQGLRYGTAPVGQTDALPRDAALRLRPQHDRRGAAGRPG